MTGAQETAVEELRGAVRFFSHWDETWNEQWSISELISIYRFAMSDEGKVQHEDPRRWGTETLARAIGHERDRYASTRAVALVLRRRLALLSREGRARVMAVLEGP